MQTRGRSIGVAGDGQTAAGPPTPRQARSQLLAFLGGAIAIAIVALAALAPGARAADTETIGTLDRVAPVAAADGRVVWSDYVSATHSWQLMTRSGGVNSPVAVPTRSTAFDVDLGTDDSGHQIATYSRCAKKPSTDTPTPEPRSGVDTGSFGCDAYAYDFVDHREFKLPGVNSSGDETWPTADGGRVAFVRTYPSRSGRSGRTPYLYTRPFDSSASSRRLARPPSCPPNGSVGCPDFGIQDLDMVGRKVAYAWHTFDEEGFSRIHVSTTGGALYAISDRVSNPGGADIFAQSVHDPEFAGGRVYWRLTNTGEPRFASLFYRRPVLGTGKRTGHQESTTTSNGAVSYSQNGDDSVYPDAQDDNGQPNEDLPIPLKRTTGFSWTTNPPDIGPPGGS